MKILNIPKMLLPMFLTAFLLYAALCGLLFVFERELLYHPVAARGNTSKILILPTSRVSVSVANPTAANALIYFGGNAEDVSYTLPEFAKAFPEHALYFMHYRGYGNSPGSPNEKDIKADASDLLTIASQRHKHIVLIGRSLGSGVAIALAKHAENVKSLILITPYDSIKNVASEHFSYFPIRWLMTDTYESILMASHVRVPTLLLVANGDQVISNANSQRLHNAFAPGVASLVRIDGVDHNTISESDRYFREIKSMM